ncbi:MAG: YggS family pyridoxal phosphate-dependent enzyme [Bdellovibrionales bacterium]
MTIELAHFRDEITRVCEKAGRDPRSVRLVAVSKLQPLSKIHEAHREGQLDFGENYVQEALEKMAALQMPDVRWHLIGPVQSNKINKILKRFYLIHSVDSLKTAEEINKRAQREGHVQPVLLQLNLAQEATKSGQSESDLRQNWNRYRELKNLEIQGLMTMPPLEGPSTKYFQQLRDLAQEFGLRELSMGTSSDWKEAIACGATMIRIGTAVFGERS